MYTADSGTCDRAIDPTNQNQYIVWGIGSLGATAFQHHTRAESKYLLLYLYYGFMACVWVVPVCDMQTIDKQGFI